MTIELLSITPDIEKHIELCGRTCYQSFDKITKDSAAKFIKMIIKSGHESVIEHGVATFRIKGISRACSHQLVRHRIFSFSQQSQRYVKEDQFEYIIPESILKCKDSEWVHERIYYDKYIDLMEDIQELYTFFVEAKKETDGNITIKPEDARFILPNACSTEIVGTANMREWRHFLKERLATGAQWEIKDLAKEILKQLKEQAPNIFYDFE